MKDEARSPFRPFHPSSFRSTQVAIFVAAKHTLGLAFLARELSQWKHADLGREPQRLPQVFDHVRLRHIGIGFDVNTDVSKTVGFLDNDLVVGADARNTHQDERKFTFEVVRPAFDNIRKIFGVKPLIVRLVDIHEEGDISTQYYPIELKDKLFQ